jgi:hypothetical protein
MEEESYSYEAPELPAKYPLFASPVRRPAPAAPAQAVDSLGTFSRVLFDERRGQRRSREPEEDEVPSQSKRTNIEGWGGEPLE